MKKMIGRIFAILISVVVIAVLSIVLYEHFANGDGNTRITNDEAEKDEQGRYLTIINDTGQVINDVYITVGEGTEIESGYQKNPDEKSFSVEISKDYEEYSTFTITFIDRYGIKYEKTVENVKEKGRTEIKLSDDDYIEQEGDFKRKIDRFFNGD